MTSSFKFTPDQRGIDDVLTGPDLGKFLTDVAVDAAGRIEKHGPTSKDSFMGWKGSVVALPARPDGDSIAALVGSESPGWHLVEYGTATTQPYAAIRKGVRETGVRFEEGST